MSYQPATAPAAAAARVVIKALDGLPTPDRLLALRSVAVLLGTRRAATVVVARSEGFSWAEIADRLGMSRQSVWERYGTEEGEVPQPTRGRRPAAPAAPPSQPQPRVAETRTQAEPERLRSALGQCLSRAPISGEIWTARLRMALTQRLEGCFQASGSPPLSDRTPSMPPWGSVSTGCSKTRFARSASTWW